MSEKMHWYTTEGESRHDATLREAKKEGLLPSVTKITSILSNPALVEYAKDQVLQAALMVPPNGKDYDEWKKEVFAASNEHRNEAASAGTILHGWTEMFLSGKDIPQKEYADNRDAARIWDYFLPWLEENLVPGGRREETLVSKTHQFAGRTDYIGQVVDDPREFIIDFKFRNIKHPGYKKDGGLKAVRKPVYDTDVMQLAAYTGADHEMKAGEEAEGKDLKEFIDGSIQPMSVVVSSNQKFPYIYTHEWPIEEVKQWFEGFIAARTLSRIMWSL